MRPYMTSPKSSNQQPMSITGHMLVQNEDRFIWYAITSVLPFLDVLLITDNGSTDHTVDIINSIASPKIKLTQLQRTDRVGLVERRRQQLRETSTDFFLLIDGDEIWPRANLQQLISTAAATPQSVGFVCRTRNCIGDIFHYQPESAGRYHFLNRTGHLTIRLIRHHPELSLAGEYPLEGYQYQQTPLDRLSEPQLTFVDTWYLHTTHLSRSTSTSANASVIDRLAKYKLEIGVPLPPSDLPEVFSLTRPSIVPNPFALKYTPMQKMIAHVVTPLRQLRRQFYSV